jgi:hypothetical protein
MHDVEPHLYATIIREMIRHENDVTNHRIMWLLIGQGLIANAYVGAGSQRGDVVSALGIVGILVALSAFVILYKSYQARGYLEFLGEEAKRGTLEEENLPLFGWPARRIKGWRTCKWLCPWLRQPGDLLEPYLFLPSLLALAWLFLLMDHYLSLGKGAILALSMLLDAVVLSGLCIVWVRAESKREEEPKHQVKEPPSSLPHSATASRANLSRGHTQL